MTLGKRLIALRRRSRLTQNDVAKSLSVSRGAISMWEINQRTPDPETLKNIADLFNVSVDWLLGRNKQQTEFCAPPPLDDPIQDLPLEARRSLDEFREYLLKKYGEK